MKSRRLLLAAVGNVSGQLRGKINTEFLDDGLCFRVGDDEAELCSGDGWEADNTAVTNGS